MNAALDVNSELAYIISRSLLRSFCFDLVSGWPCRAFEKLLQLV